MATRAFVCFLGIAPTIGDTAIGQSIIQGLQRRLALPVRVHADRPDVFASLPELDAGMVHGKLPQVPLPAFGSPGLPLRLDRLRRDLRATGGVRVLPAGVYAALRDALEGCAAVIVQGGPNWNDRWMNGRKALERWLFLQTVRHYGACAYHVGVSCGPFAWKYPRRLWMAPVCRRALDAYDMLIVRDRFSRPSLERLGVATPVVESTDAAVFLQPQRDPAFAHVEERVRAGAHGRRKVVVCVRDYQPLYGDTLQARDAVLAALARVLDHVQQHRGDVFFLSTDHNPSPEKQTDDEVARGVQRMMTAPGSVVIDADVRNPAALKHIYGQFDAMVSMRLHPTILALEQGVPCLLLSYDDKCRDFFARLDLQSHLVPLAEFRHETAVPLITGLLEDRALPARIRANYRRLQAAHAGDCEPMYRQIAVRAREISGDAPTRAPALAASAEEARHG